MLKSTGLSTVSWGTLLFTGLQLPFMSLITMFWAWLFSQSSVLPHCPLTGPVLYLLVNEDAVSDSVKIHPEVKVDNMHCSPHVPGYLKFY